MREMSLEDGPTTVDAGHLQLEFDPLNLARDHDGDHRNEAWTWAALNCRIGLTDSAELQLAINPLDRLRTINHSLQTREVRHGFGDTTVRLKFNLWGNDGGASALALEPYVKVPTAGAAIGNKAFEGGLLVPMAFELTGGFSADMLFECDAVRNEADDGYTAAFAHAVTLNRALGERWEAFVECSASLAAESDSSLVVAAGIGVSCTINDDVQLETGIGFGLTDAAEDFTGYIRIGIRR